MSHREHGTNAKYKVEGCRCRACSLATSKHNRARARSIEPAYVAAGPARAHCRELSEAGVGPALFFPGSGDWTTGQTAKAVCSACPVADECRRFAVDSGERAGIWGGINIHPRYVDNENAA